MSDRLDNFAANRTTFQGSQKLAVAAEQQAHDFLDFLDPIHETPRRILRHLASSIALNDFGATAFCLRSLHEGMTHLFMAREIGEKQISEFIPQKKDGDSPATSQIREWLILKNFQEPTSIAVTKSTPNQLLVRIQPTELELLVNDAEW